MDGEDYSVADIVHKELLNVKHVKFAGVAPPHPLIKTLTLQIHTDGADANKVLRDALAACQAKLADLLVVAKQTFPSLPKADMSETSSAQSSVTESVSPSS